jgi:hypothetical protein
MTNKDENPHRSWADIDRDSERFRRLLAKYRNDYQDATEAYLRGEDGPHTAHGSENPM